jgi:hypothetical protein
MAWVACIVFIVYPLSTGPALCLYEKGIARSEIEAFYTPLVSVVRHSDLLEAFFEWYLLELWQIDPYL